MTVSWEAPLDPSDRDYFVASFAGDESPVLGATEKIASFTVVPTEKATSYGLVIVETGDYAPSKTNDDTAILLWLEIPEDKRGNCEFRPGILLGVEVTIETDSVPPRRLQRTWAVTVRNL